MLGRFKLQNLTAMDEVWIVVKTILELSKSRRFACRRVLLLGYGLCGGSGSLCACLRLFVHYLASLVGLNALQVDLLHGLQFHVGL